MNPNPEHEVQVEMTLHNHNQALPAIGLVRHELRVRMLRVAAVRRPTPRLVELTLQGDDLMGFVSAAPDDHVKVLFPGPGQETFTPPTLRQGQVQWPSGPARPIARDYTPLAFDPVARTLTLEIVLHEAGAGSQRAQSARVGQVLGVVGPRGSHVLRFALEGLLLVGDETALPAIRRWLSELPPATRVHAWIEVADTYDERALPTAAQASVHWIHRGSAAPGSSRCLEEALAAASLPDPLSYAWVAGEADRVRRIRNALRERGIAPDRISARGYWKRGVTNHQEPHAD